MFNNLNLGKKPIVGLCLGCLFIGTVIALVGLYQKGLEIAIVGLVFIAAGIIIMELLYKKL